MTVGVDSGQGRSVPAVAQQLVDRLRGLDQDLFTYRAHEVGGPGASTPTLFDDTFWNGPPQHGVRLHGDLGEWSCEAVGWLGEVVADCAAATGVEVPLLLSVTRSAAPGG